MSLSFPLSLSDFADTLSIKQVKWLLKDNRELSGMGSGQILEADLAPQLWQGDVTLSEMDNFESRKVEAKLNAIIRSIGSFYLYDPRTRYPYADRDGSKLGTNTPTIGSLPDSKSMSLAGLPSGYILTEGDYLTFDYGDPSRRAFHEIVEAVTAAGDGTTSAFEVNPFLPDGATTGTSVTLIKPAMKCRIVPGSLSVESTNNIFTTQITFSVMQKH